MTTGAHVCLPPLQRALVSIGIMAATLMQVLDTTIVNVALPHMEGSLAATHDQISWVLTSYLVSSAILMPLTGYFSERLGRRNYLFISIIGFIIASCLCGAATSLSQIVAFRLLQGVFGAALVPLSQAIMTDIFPKEEHGMAMAIWGMGVMIGPILGPTLGGYLTDVATWRWNFYINIPVGILSLFLLWRYLPDTKKSLRGMNWLGLSLISLLIGATQYLLDRGNQQDWFSSWDIRIAALFIIIGLLGFVFPYLRKSINGVVNLSVFRDRNFSLSCLLIAMFGLGLYGTMVMLPIMLEDLLNYPVLTTGINMAPRGVSSMIAMLFVGKMMRKIDARLIIAMGIVISCLGTAIDLSYSLNISSGWISWPMFLQGFGMGMIFTPLSVIAFSTLTTTFRTEAAGMYSLLRTIGSSIGISIVSTLYSRQSQTAWNQIGSSIQPYNPALETYLDNHQLTLDNPVAAQVLGQELAQQAGMVAMLDVFTFICWSFAIMLVMLILLKKPKKVIHDMDVVE